VLRLATNGYKLQTPIGMHIVHGAVQKDCCLDPHIGGVMKKIATAFYLLQDKPCIECHVPLVNRTHIKIRQYLPHLTPRANSISVHIRIIGSQLKKIGWEHENSTRCQPMTAPISRWGKGYLAIILNHINSLHHTMGHYLYTV